jgi:hypothetical protein
VLILSLAGVISRHAKSFLLFLHIQNMQKHNLAPPVQTDGMGYADNLCQRIYIGFLFLRMCSRFMTSDRLELC